MTLFRPAISQETKEEVGKLFPYAPHFGDKVNALVHHHKMLKVAATNKKMLRLQNESLTRRVRLLKRAHFILLTVSFIELITILALWYEVLK